MDAWIEIEVFTTTDGLDPLTAALAELEPGGFTIRDAADFDEFLKGKQGRWDYLDQELMQLRDCESSVTFYLPENAQGRARLSRLEGILARLGERDREGAWGRLEARVSAVREEDWANNWKKYWSPARIGERLVVCPTWESWEESPGDVVLRLDPGMAFGSGTHHSTRMCLELLQERLQGGEAVLDLGCGSGILSVAALLLGADRARGVDIEQVAADTAAENAALNGVADRARYSVGDLARGIDGRFNIIFANIVADVILTLLPDLPRLLAPDGILIASGIIDDRAEEVEGALSAAGLSLLEKREDGGWVAMVITAG